MGFGQSKSQEQLREQHLQDAERRQQQHRLSQQRQQEQQRVQRVHQQHLNELQLQRQREREQQQALARQQAEYATLSLAESVQRALRCALEGGVDEVGFEREFKKQLTIFAPNATVQRKGGAQFEVSAPNQKQVFASLRLDAAPNVLQQFRSLAPAVRKTLLGDSAQWLRRLGRNGESIDGFLAAVQAAREAPTEARDGQPDGEMCERCGQSLRKDCLPGAGHLCRMLVKFRCPQCGKSWTTQRGRYSVKENRMLGHDCAGCGSPGEVESSEILTEQALEALAQRKETAQRLREEREEKRRAKDAWWQSARWSQGDSWQSWNENHGDDWWLSSSWGQGPSSTQEGDRVHDAETFVPRNNEPVAMLGEVSMLIDGSENRTVVPRISTEQHRSDLCEGCKRYADCSGLFIEPFQVFAIAKLLSMDEGVDPDDDDLQWREANGAMELVGFTGGPVRLLPHIYEESAHIPPEEAARITREKRNTFLRQNVPSSLSSRSQTSGSSSQSRTIRSSEDQALRRHFQGR